MMRYLALGDSYTIGEGVSWVERWPVRLTQRLRDRGVPIAAPLIIARTGWTTDELAAGIVEAHLTRPFDLVTLLIGVNNQYRGRELAEYREQFYGLLNQAIDLAGDRPGRVLVFSLPDWGVTPFAAGIDRQRVAAEIDAFNQVNRAGARVAGTRYVEITPLTRQWGDHPDWVSRDGLHPGGKMYAAWAELALPIALAALQK